MADKKAKKVEIWTVVAPFTLDGVEYAEGDEWAKPADYELDEAATAGNGGRPVFTYGLAETSKSIGLPVVRADGNA